MFYLWAFVENCWKAAAWFLEQSFGGAQMESVEKYLWLSKTEGFGSTYWGSVNSILDKTIGFGFAVITVFFLAAVLSKVQTETLTVDALIKLTIQLIIAGAVIGNIREIVNGLLSFGESVLNMMPGIGDAATATSLKPEYKKLLEEVAKKTPSATDTWQTVNMADVIKYGDSNKLPTSVPSAMQDVFQKINASEYIAKATTNSIGETLAKEWREDSSTIYIQALIESAIIWLLHQVAIIGIDFAAFTRGIELGWRIAFAPIFAANTFEGGMNSPGIRYLKTLLGVIISGAAIWAVAKIGFSMSADILKADTSANMWASVGCLLATAGAAIGVGNKVSSLFG